MEILVIIGLVVLVAVVNLRWLVRRRRGGARTDAGRGEAAKTHQMNDLRREREERDE